MTTGAVPAWTLTNRLVRSREHAGLEQAQLADLLGISRQSVSNYERGVRAPKRHLVMAWAALTGVDLEWLEGDDDHLRARRDSNPQPSDWESDQASERALYGRAA